MTCEGVIVVGGAAIEASAIIMYACWLRVGKDTELYGVEGANVSFMLFAGRSSCIGVVCWSSTALFDGALASMGAGASGIGWSLEFASTGAEACAVEAASCGRVPSAASALRAEVARVFRADRGGGVEGGGCDAGAVAEAEVAVSLLGVDDLGTGAVEGAVGDVVDGTAGAGAGVGVGADGAAAVGGGGGGAADVADDDDEDSATGPAAVEEGASAESEAEGGTEVAPLGSRLSASLAWAVAASVAVAVDIGAGVVATATWGSGRFPRASGRPLRPVMDEVIAVRRSSSFVASPSRGL